MYHILKYYIVNDIITDKPVRAIFKSGNVSDLMGGVVKLTIMNNSVNDFIIPQGAIVAKMFIYAEINT